MTHKRFTPSTKSDNVSREEKLGNVLGLEVFWGVNGVVDPNSERELWRRRGFAEYFKKY